MLEVGYGINLRPLSTFAEQVYGKESCEMYLPKTLDLNEYDPVDLAVAARMNKAITIMMFKVEGQRIKAHPEYGMNDRLLMDKVNWEDCTIEIDGKVHKLKDTYFPTVDPKDPCRLSPEEYQVLEALEASILKSEKLQKHIRYLFDHGALYKIINGNLLYHGCVPMDEKGEFMKVSLNGVTVSGKDLFDYLDKQVRAAYFSPDESEETGRSGDLMWYLWQGKKSPLFGKDKIATFERLLLEDKALHKENQNAYYRHIKRKGPCMKILREFGLGDDSKIINGHVPVKLKDGESPIKGGGKLYVIDGGIAKAYQKTTGIAGYTLVFNSRFIALAEHKPYQPMKEDGTQEFFSPKFQVVEYLPKRMLVRDTDHGEDLKEEIEDMKELIRAFRRGLIKQTK